MNGDNNPNNKGLGWIPDYPDLRDYRLGSGDINDPETGRLKREERSKEIEQIAGGVINLIENLSSLLDSIENSTNIDKSRISNQFLSRQVKGLKTEIGKQVSEIQLAIFGDVSFEAINIYRQLRKGAESKTPFSPADAFVSDSDIGKRIVELKNYLYFIFLYFIFQKKESSKNISLSEDYPKEETEENLKINQLISDTKATLEALEKPGKVLIWLKEECFDDHTDRLVQLFQYCADIWRDGIVGLETYTTLNNYLEAISNFQKRSDFQQINKFAEKFNNFFALQEYPQNPSENYQPKASLLPISLILPEESFKRVLSHLEQWTIERISAKDSQGKYQDEDIFEEKYLQNELKIEENSGIFNELLGADNSLKSREKKDVEEWINNKSKALFEAKKGNRKSFKFVSILQKEFHLIEPIVAVVIKILTPLAKFRNDSWEEIISRGLSSFEKVFSPSGTDAEKIPIPKEFALQALEQVESIFNSEFAFKVSSRMTDGSDISATLYFYFLVIKSIRRFELYSSSTGSNNSDNLLLNPFEKQEVFEVKKNCSPVQMEFFKIPSLQIPLRRAFLESFGFKELELINSSKMRQDSSSELKRYLFLPSIVDLSYWCSKIEDQGRLNTCTALAGVALIEYFMNRTNGRYTDASSLFLYKATRNLMNLKGDVGASVRETMKAMALFGIPPEQYWKYDETKVNEEPPSFCYSFAQNYQALKYFRLDYAGISRDVLLIQIKAVIAAGFPCIFGFTIYTSAYEDFNQRNGLIPFPHYTRDRVVGGHSVVAVGYDDYKKIERKDRSEPSEGALLIRNSFGSEWGDGGYGWLPYDYVLAGLTADWWSLLKAEWFSDEFWQGVRGSQGPITEELRQ